MTFNDFGNVLGAATLEKVAADTVTIVDPGDNFSTLAQRSAAIDKRQAVAEAAERDARAAERQAVNRRNNFEKAQQRARQIIKDERALNRTQIEESNLLRKTMQREGLNGNQINEFFNNYGTYKRDAEQGKKEIEKLKQQLAEAAEREKGSHLLSTDAIKKVFTPKRLAIGGGAALVGGAGLYGLHHLMKNKGDYEFLND